MAEKHKQVLLIFIVFLLLESLYQLIALGITGMIYKAVGFTEFQYSFVGVLGCSQFEHRPLVDYFFTAYNFCLVIGAFLLAKFSNQKFISLLISAVLIFHFASGTLNHIVVALLKNKIPFMPYLNKSKMDIMQMPFWGNYFNFKISMLILYYVRLVFSIFVSYQLVFVLWPKWFVKQIFTYGIIASAAGILLWYFLIGPWIFPFPKL